MEPTAEPSKADEGQSRLTVGLDAPYLPDYVWEVANPLRFGASAAVDKMNDMLLAFDPNTPARNFSNHHLAMGIMEREQPSIHETIRRMMAANA